MAKAKLYVIDTSDSNIQHCPNCPLKSKAMPLCDVANPSLIVDQPHKWKMALNGLCRSCIQLWEVEDPVRSRDKRQELKEEWSKRAK